MSTPRLDRDYQPFPSANGMIAPAEPRTVYAFAKAKH